jgi:hypothetical protein
VKKEIPENIKDAIPGDIWEEWDDEQREYVIEHEGKEIGSVTLGEGTNIRYYSDKKWKIGEARPRYTEICEKCGFPYCFHAVPGNWSMRSSVC